MSNASRKKSHLKIVHSKKSDEFAELDQVIEKVKAAQAKYSNYTQEQVDKIVLCAATAVSHERIKLAQEAVEETQMGVVEDKVIKNHFAAEFVYNKYREEKTCGEILCDPVNGIHVIAEPVGVIAGIVPTTNPTSTIIFKTLITLKTRNAIVFSPHPRAKNCCNHTAKILHDAAVAAGAPEGIVGWIENPTIELTQYLMKHKDIALILATGGPGMVKSAYSSGTPAIGVGAGNTPAVIDETADIPMVTSSILLSKTFDNGVICASEQSVIAVDEIYDALKKEFLLQGAYILKPAEREKVGKIILKDGRLNSDIVGKAAATIAEMAGVKVPKTAKVLIGETTRIEEDEPFAHEKLSTILALYRASDFKEAVEKAKALIAMGGLGHTAVLYTHESNEDRISYYGNQIRVGRVLVNTPSSQGAIGDIYNFRLNPSLTLGTGTYGGNIISENIEPRHLLYIKTIAERRENMLWLRVPPKIYFKRGSLPEALRELEGYEKVFIVTDRPIAEMGYVRRIIDVLEELHVRFEIFKDVKPDPDLLTVSKALERANLFQPDAIIAIGGGSPMDAGKLLWLLYEQPEIKFDDLSMRFMDIRKRIVRVPKLGKKAMFVAVPTTSGTGSEVTPFAVITDNQDGVKYPIADYALTPDMAIIDPDLVMHMPKPLTAAGGIDAVTHAIEAIVAITATVYTTSMAIEALQLLFEYLPAAYEQGAKNPKAREKVHFASTMAGIAFANAFLGLNHSMAHKLGAAFHIPHGIANALVLSHVIRFNATYAPLKQGIFSQYRTPEALQRYASIADRLHLGGKTQEQKVEKLISAIEKLKRQIDIPRSIKEWGVPEEEFLGKLDALSELAFDDQCTGTNPRYPLIPEIRELFLKAYYGKEE